MPSLFGWNLLIIEILFSHSYKVFHWWVECTL